MIENIGEQVFSKLPGFDTLYPVLIIIVGNTIITLIVT